MLTSFKKWFVILKIENTYSQEAPGGLLVKTQNVHYHGPGTISGWGSKIPQAMWPGQKIQTKLKICIHSDPENMALGIFPIKIKATVHKRTTYKVENV